MSECRLFHVSGRVQGVFFRASARQEGQRLGLTGWARNLPGGDVEVLACGGAAALDAFAAWLAQGPPMAQVVRVSAEPAAVEPPAAFTIRYD